MGQKLTEKHIAAIERVLNAKGRTEAVVKVEEGRIVVIQVEKKKID